MSPTVDELRVEAIDARKKELKCEIREIERLIIEAWKESKDPEVGYCDVCEAECPHCAAAYDEGEEALDWAETMNAPAAFRELMEKRNESWARLRRLENGFNAHGNLWD